MNPNTNDRPESSSPETNNQPEIIYYQEEPILPQKEPKTRSLNPKKLLIAGAVVLIVLGGGWFASLKLLTFLADGGKCFGVDRIICYRAAIFLNPFDADLYRHVASLQMVSIASVINTEEQKNDAFRESMEYFNQAIRLQPSMAPSNYLLRADLIKWINWEHSYLKGEKFTRQAIADYDEAIRLKPNGYWVTEVYISRGRLKVSLGDKQGALSDYREICDLYKQRRDIAAYNMVQEEIKSLGG